MSYYFSKEVSYSYEEAIEKTKLALKENGFGVITEIDMKSVLKNKIDKDISPYIILGACSPNYAYHALQEEDNIGLLLPCNVIVRKAQNGKTIVAIINPIESMNPVNNPSLEEMATEVTEKLQLALQNV